MFPAFTESGESDDGWGFWTSLSCSSEPNALLTEPCCCGCLFSGWAEMVTYLKAALSEFGLFNWFIWFSLGVNLRNMIHELSRLNHFCGLWSEIRRGVLGDKITWWDELWSAHCQGLFCLLGHLLHKVTLLSVYPFICVTFHLIWVKGHS